MNNEIKVILFDLGRVLMHIDFDAFPNGLGLTTTELRAQYDQTKIQHAIREYETGKMSTIQFYELLFGLFQGRYSKNTIQDAFDSIIVEDNQQIIPFVKTMKQQYRVAILSNTCASHWKKIIRISAMVKLFPDCFTSFQLGVMKPKKSAYEKVCTSLQVLPNEIVFIDDLKENVDGALAVGLRGIVFTSADQLQRDFLDKKW